MKTQAREVGTIRTREDVERLLLAVEAAALLEAGAHRREEPFAEVRHGRDFLRSLAARELRQAAQPTLRVAGVRP